MELGIKCSQYVLERSFFFFKEMNTKEKYPTPGRDTRSANKVNFKVPTKISHVYERSPYYIGTKLWESLPEMTQKCDYVFADHNG